MNIREFTPYSALDPLYRTPWVPGTMNTITCSKVNRGHHCQIACLGGVEQRLYYGAYSPVLAGGGQCTKLWTSRDSGRVHSDTIISVVGSSVSEENAFVEGCSDGIWCKNKAPLFLLASRANQQQIPGDTHRMRTIAVGRVATKPPPLHFHCGCLGRVISRIGGGWCAISHILRVRTND